MLSSLYIFWGKYSCCKSATEITFQEHNVQQWFATNSEQPRKIFSLQHLTLICFSFPDRKGICKICLPTHLCRWGELRHKQQKMSSVKPKINRSWSALLVHVSSRWWIHNVWLLVLHASARQAGLSTKGCIFVGLDLLQSVYLSGAFSGNCSD